MPFPSWADVGYLGAAPFAVAAALLLADRIAGASRLRSLLDGVLIGLSLFYLAWAFLMGPLYRSDLGGGDLLVVIATTRYGADTRDGRDWSTAAVRAPAALHRPLRRAPNCPR